MNRVAKQMKFEMTEKLDAEKPNAIGFSFVNLGTEPKNNKNDGTQQSLFVHASEANAQTKFAGTSGIA